jgi:uroporphyrinogen decarboxylase
MLYGVENFSYLLYDAPETVGEIFTAMTDYAIEAMGIMKEAGAHAVLFSDDYGSVTQPLFSLEHYRQFFVPQLRRLAEAAKKLGLPPILHSDGHIRPFVPGVAEAGMVGLHPIERAAGMDLGEVKAAYGDRLCLFGNVENKYLLAQGTPEEVAAQARACIQTAGPGGGYCLGSDHSIHEGVPNRNVFALYEAGRRYGRYPLQL